MYCTLKMIERNNRPHIIGFGVDGIRLGEMMYDLNYVEWKTFVNRELAYSKQKEWEHKLNIELMMELKETENKETYNLPEIKSLKNRVVALPLLAKDTG